MGEQFRVGGSLIQAWVGHKSLVRKDNDENGPDAGHSEATEKSSERHGGFKGERVG